MPGNLEVNVFYERGKLAYSFTHEGKDYGNAIKLEKKGVMDIINASLLLFTNAVETRQALN